MKNHLLKALSAFVTVILAFNMLTVPAFAAKTVLEKGTCGEDIKYVLYSDGELVITGSGIMDSHPWTANSSVYYSIKKVTISEGVTIIGYQSFMECRNITSVTIPSTVTWIGESAFYRCANLSQITLPKGLTTIGNNAFSHCASLTEINIPDGVTSIGGAAFQDCSSLTEIIIPQGVTSIGSYAFDGCSSLTEITIPDSVTSIGYRAFGNCSSLTEITIPDSVTSIDWYAFQNCSSLTEITIPDSVTSIGIYAFQNCSSLTEITIPDSVTSIGVSAFYGCSSLTKVNMPETVVTSDYYYISGSMFYGCTKLREIAIPNGVRSIDSASFYGCTKMTNAYIPASVTSIADDAFGECYSLTITGYRGSYAETFANEHNIPFEVAAGGNVADSITLSQSKVSLSLGHTFQLDLPVLPSEASDPVIWTSSNSTAVSVTQTGLITSHAYGYATITATTASGKTAQCEVTSGYNSTSPGSGQSSYGVIEVTQGTTYTPVPEDIGESGALSAGPSWSAATVYSGGNTDEAYLLSIDTEGNITAGVGVEAGTTLYTSVSYTLKSTGTSVRKDFIIKVLAAEPELTVESKIVASNDETFSVLFELNHTQTLKSIALTNFTYDTSVFELVGGEWRVDESIIADWDDNNDIAAVAFGDNQNVNGIIFELTFKVIDPAKEGDYYVGCDIIARSKTPYGAEDQVPVKVTHGKITISPVLKGDMDGNGVIDSDDAIYLLYHTFLPDMFPANQYCDFDNNGYVTSDDAIYLLYYTFLPDMFPLK